MADPKEDKVEVMEDEEEIEEIDATGDASDKLKAAALTASLMQSPGMLAALQDKMGGMIGTSSGYIQSLPKVVKRRLKALKKLQNEMIKIEAKFYEEVHELECKYADQYAPLNERRREIVTAKVEPTDSDCDWPSDEEEEDADLSADLQSKAKLEEIDETKESNSPNKDSQKEDTNDEKKEEEDAKGVPEFWLTIFKNVGMLNDMVQEHDEPILKELTDIKVNFSHGSSPGFTLEFHFAPNDFFTNSVLTKAYEMRTDPDEDDPFSYEGPEIIKCQGCKIDWKKGKNVTVKVVKKTQKHKGRGTKRTVTKTVQNDSFFNFFSPPEVTEDEETDEETEQLLAADFEIGHFIRERIVARAVLYFTGEALEDDDDFEDDGEEDDEEDEDGDYNEDDDPDFQPSV